MATRRDPTIVRQPAYHDDFHADHVIVAQPRQASGELKVASRQVASLNLATRGVSVSLSGHPATGGFVGL